VIPVLPAFDSVVVVVDLNDTVFSASEYELYREGAVRYRPAPDSLVPWPCMTPTGVLVVRNRSSMELLFPQEHLHCGSASDVDCEIRVALGPVDGSGAAIQYMQSDVIGHFVNHYEQPGYYSTIAAGESRSLDSEVVDILRAANVFRIEPGLYWVSVGYESLPIVDAVPPIWHGVVWSDTVFFRVTE